MSPDATRDELRALRERVVSCTRCPRLVAWREEKAEEKRAAYQEWEYWGRPVPGFGDPEPRLLIVGLAPAAHGANRTGRVFTGDHSGNFLFRALHRAGFANRPTSEHRGDGLELEGAYVTAAVRCAPPDNRPTPRERKNCRAYLEREVGLFLEGLRAVVPLGGYAYAHVLRIFRDRGWEVPSPMPDFGHGLEVVLAPPPRREGTRGGERERLLHLVASYHPSQQNTFTGTLTEEMFDRIWRRARELCG